MRQVVIERELIYKENAEKDWISLDPRVESKVRAPKSSIAGNARPP